MQPLAERPTSNVSPQLRDMPKFSITLHTILWSGGSVLLVLCALIYSMMMLSLSRLRRTGRPPAATPCESALADLFVVFVLPCLNEARVVGASLERLTGLDHQNIAVMVIDDGSDDDTGAIVTAFGDPRVHLLQRVAPNARQGKGEALNAAVAHIAASPLVAGRDPSRVIIAVLDADGRLEGRALDEVLPYFDDEAVGGVQIGVRINNRHVHWLARMQDFEFVVFTNVFQRGRRLAGSVGLGGNGQFMRLSALQSLGPAPWSKSLTEDLDLGVRLIANGWRNEFCPTAAVHQQGLVDLPRLVKQRTRWFQGHLQSWALIPTVLRDIGGRARADLLYHLTSPLQLLLASILSLSFVVGLVGSLVGAADGRSPFTWWLLSAYLLSVGPTVLLSLVVYRQHEPRLRGGALGAIAVAHLYVLYCLMWYLAGWRAVARTLRGTTGWVKTDRIVETASTTQGPDAALGAVS